MTSLSQKKPVESSLTKDQATKRPMSNKMRETIVGYLFLLPALIFFAIFVLFPIIQGIYISFYDYTMSTFNFIGFDHYVNLMQDSVFTKSLWNTVLLVIGTVPFIIIFSLFVSNAIF